ncbi:hypothetical protein NP233_g7527 [Leucocoprinus birnbaumii]|uniref:Uncharacterized protein n=1 Tax=Leucocoprinus birnbaumii TaxID=56174 RepID=A0AAD5YSP7_9AGAR|nr:hypothetical protein NP233_g7527 [Leucocoprinus birnbaumii]
MAPGDGLPETEIEFLSEFKDELIRRRENDPIFNLSRWTRTTFRGKYFARFGKNPDSGDQQKIYNWFKNHTDPVKEAVKNLRKQGPQYTLSTAKNDDSVDHHDDDSSFERSSSHEEERLPSFRVQSFRDVVVDHEKEAIQKLMSIRTSEQNLSRSEYMTQWNTAVSEVIENLDEESREYYRAIASAAASAHEAPSKEEVLKLQKHLPHVAHKVLSGLLGWKKKNYGDAVLFLSTAFRDEKDDIYIQRFFVSNIPDYQDTTYPFLRKYDSLMTEEMDKIATVLLPSETSPRPGFRNHTLICFDLSKRNPFCSRVRSRTLFSVRFATAHFSLYTTALGHSSRIEATVPWKALESPSGRKVYLIGHAELDKIQNLNPTSMHRDDVPKVAEMLYRIPDLLQFREPASSSSRADNPLSTSPGALNSSSGPASTAISSPDDVPEVLGTNPPPDFASSAGSEPGDSDLASPQPDSDSLILPPISSTITIGEVPEPHEKQQPSKRQRTKKVNMLPPREHPTREVRPVERGPTLVVPKGSKTAVKRPLDDRYVLKPVSSDLEPDVVPDLSRDSESEVTLSAGKKRSKTSGQSGGTVKRGRKK